MRYEPEARPGVVGRALIRRRGHVALATLCDRQPYVSLVASACGLDGSPLLLLSDLAQHTRNLKAEPAASLLFEDTAGMPDPLAGSRLTVIGRAALCADRHAFSRFIARHPAAASYAGFADFRLYRVEIERGHLVAGFGRIAWIEAEDLRLAGDWPELAAGEAGIVADINANHPAALAAIVAHRLQRVGTGWQMSGIDPEGFDLRRGNDTARIDFAAPAPTPAAAREALVTLTRQAHAAKSD
jgi:putative heme iron utilization protein